MKYITAEVVKSYLERWGDIADLTLAKKICKENPGLFTSLDHARSIIRQYRGKKGKERRKQLQDRRFIRDEHILSTDNKYELPESDALDYPVFKFPKAQNRILICGDFHIPYHDVDAVTAMITWAKEHGINTVLLNGDIIDCYSLSTFVRDPRKRRFVEERDVLWRFLDAFQKALPDCVFYYKQGNHEERYERYLQIKAPELFDTPEFQLDILFKLGERGIIWIGDKIRIVAGSLNIFHGHELGRGGGGSLINVSRWIYMRAGDNTLANHFHKTSEFVQTSVSDKIISCYSVGCLSHLKPEYMPNNNWNHGFARARINPDDSFELTNLKIYEGRVL